MQAKAGFDRAGFIEAASTLQGELLATLNEAAAGDFSLAARPPSSSLAPIAAMASNKELLSFLLDNNGTDNPQQQLAGLILAEQMRAVNPHR